MKKRQNTKYTTCGRPTNKDSQCNLQPAIPAAPLAVCGLSAEIIATIDLQYSLAYWVAMMDISVSLLLSWRTCVFRRKQWNFRSVLGRVTIRTHWLINAVPVKQATHVTKYQETAMSRERHTYVWRLRVVDWRVGGGEIRRR